MANEEHLAILRQGVEVWNEWKKDNPKRRVDLRHANLSGTNLSRANLEGANLREANLGEANLEQANFDRAFCKGANFRASNLQEASLRQTYLQGANLKAANLIRANFKNANLENSNLEVASLGGANFERAFLRNANLLAHIHRCNLRNSILEGANLGGANLQNVDLSYADLSYANLISTKFSNAVLTQANLHTSQVVAAEFNNSVLTGACIADWHINSSTKLDGVICDYIYRTIEKDGQFSGRLPVDPNSTFAPGEFTQRFQILASAQETIDITFTEGIDWQAFFQSFQELRSQNPDTDISIQGMERKAEGFIVRLEVNQETDKATTETQFKQLYVQQLQVLEAQYEERLRLQGAHLEDIRELLSFERQERTRLSKVVETMANEQKITQSFHSSVGSVAGTNYGSMTAYINQNSDEVTRLLASLHKIAQEFPEAQREEVQIHLEDLASDLNNPEKCQPARMKTRIAGLFGVLLMLGGGVATATDFANNVLELSKKLDVPAETFRPQLEHFKQLYPEYDWIQR
jgi:uncharacterized protein YjbI with pentapeptide repeats